jgi:UDP-3-O-[3-hydroxymyristoyl] glucosamine N-acyltransferase
MTSIAAIVAFLGESVQAVVNMHDVEIAAVAALPVARPGELSFCSALGEPAAAALAATQASVVLCVGALLPEGEGHWPSTLTGVAVGRPRLEFSRVYQRFFAAPLSAVIHPTAVIGDDCVLNDSVSIGAYSSLGRGVSVGRGTRIGAGVFIGAGTRIGDDCDIHANTVIGEPGFGFERDDGRAVPFPHLGVVRIGDRVSIGANSCIARGALSDTIIEDDVQIDSHVHVAHNVRIGRAATIVAHSSISGSAQIGEGAWLSPGSLVLGTAVGAGAKIGVGAVVTKPVGEGATVFGNPARVVWKGR